jgi:TATA-binding protein-associated factor Taf7
VKLAAAKRRESHVSAERDEPDDRTAELTSEIDRLTGTLRSLNRSMESNSPPLGPARYKSRIDMITKELSARQRDLASMIQASNEKLLQVAR